jgi:CBS domain-containing protein
MRCPACGHDNLPGLDECIKCSGSLMQEDLPQPDTPVKRTIMVDPITELHSPVPECVPAGTTVAEAIARMTAKNVGYVLVTDADGRLAGIFTERDVLLKVAGEMNDLSQIAVDTLMTPNPTAVKPTEPIKHALFAMAHNSFRHVPILDEAGRPTGITTVRHIVEFIESISSART